MLGVVVFDFRRVCVVLRNLVRRKMTVSDGVLVSVLRLVDVLRRQRRRKHQEWRDQKQSGDAGQPNHKEIIGGV